MVVICPKCKTKLKVAETKLKPEGSRFKCPKCSSVLLVRKPSASAKKALEKRKILVAHSNPEILALASSILREKGFSVITAADGIETVVKALKEMPFLSIVEVALPKIYGVEVCKRLKARPESKEMKFLLIASIYDKTKYRRDPISLYGADDYIEEHAIHSHLSGKIDALVSARDQGASATDKHGLISGQQAETKRELAGEKAPLPPGTAMPDEERIERARRLARTIIGDIYLYNPIKLDNAIIQGNFYTVFASEIKEGRKLYESRIAQDVKDIKDFYAEAIENFLSARKQNLT